MYFSKYVQVFGKIPRVKRIGVKLLIFSIIAFVLILFKDSVTNNSKSVLSSDTQFSYWLILHRKSNREFLYKGKLGEADKSTLIKTFKVKSGVAGKRPTPLPRLLGREYWVITRSFETGDNPETAPYFLSLNIPVTDSQPYGPAPYLECDGQCNWILPGEFGLHGVNGDLSKLSDQDPGSSGCIRHSDEDITYLYNLLSPQQQEVRYYIEDI